MESELASRIRAARHRLRATRLGGVAQRVQQDATRLLAPLRRRVERLGERRQARLRRRWRGVAYDDGRVRVTSTQLVLRSYYWPTGTRRVGFDEIADVTEWPATGRASFRLHGPGRRGRWYPRDRRRPERGWGLVVELHGGRQIVVTPDDPGRVRALLDDRVARRR